MYDSYDGDIPYTYEGEGRMRGVTDMIKVALRGVVGLRHVDASVCQGSFMRCDVCYGFSHCAISSFTHS